MKTIDGFVNDVYRHANGNENEIHELKSEMKQHLLDIVEELKAEGKSEQEAIELAIERFGGETELRSIVGQLFTAQKTFAKWVLYLAIGFLIASVTLFGFLWQNEENQANELSVVATKIAAELQGKNTVTAQTKKNIEHVVDQTTFIAEVNVYNASKIRSEGGNVVFFDTDVADADYRYTHGVWAPTWLGSELYPYGNGDKQWYVEMNYRSFGELETIVLASGIAVYWTLFAIWAIVNAYHHKRLRLRWIIVFILGNVIGYVLYQWIGKRKKEAI